MLFKKQRINFIYQGKLDILKKEICQVDGCQIKSIKITKYWLGGGFIDAQGTFSTICAKI